ncbi:hypothetical protein B0H10DRAFT_2208549 [Mycena sp. CBHHK59/15]|nr:hypothetical protein B0H10DRAFT_2208549 [Mycena sp. CBHHK59/15]
MEDAHTNFMVSTFTATSAANVLEYNKATFLIKMHPSTEDFLRQIMTKSSKPCTMITHLDCRAMTHLTVVSWKVVLMLLPTLEMLTEVLRSSAHPPLWHIHIYLYMWKRSKDMSDIMAPVLTPLQQLLSVCHLHGMLLNVLEIDKQLVSLEMDEDMWEALFGTGGEFYSEW